VLKYFCIFILLIWAFRINDTNGMMSTLVVFFSSGFYNIVQD